MVLSIMCTQQVNWKSTQVSFLSLLSWDKEPRILLREAASSRSTWNHFTAIARRDALSKDANACGMELAAVHIAMVANPALTRKTASLKKVILYYIGICTYVS